MVVLSQTAKRSNRANCGESANAKQGRRIGAGNTAVFDRVYGVCSPASQDSEASHASGDSRDSDGSTVSRDSIASDDSIKHQVEEAIRRSLPETEATLREAVFNLVRRLLAIQDDWPQDWLDRVFKLFCEQASSKGVELYPDDVADVWKAVRPTVQFAEGENLARICYPIVSADGYVSPEPCQWYQDPRLQRLVALLIEMQRQQGDRSIFASCELVAELLGTYPQMASLWFQRLRRAGKHQVLELKKCYPFGQRRANRYRVLPAVMQMASESRA